MYLYTINRPSNMESIAHLESLILTGEPTESNYVFSEKYVDVENAAYMDQCIKIDLSASSLEDLYGKIDDMRYTDDGYCVSFLNVTSHTDFKARKEIEKSISNIFYGAPDLKNPKVIFTVTNIDDSWYFGRAIGKCKNRWLIYDKKPRTFCNSLPARIARALVNIASGYDKSKSLVDPCCGMGTVVMEALDMGMDTWGFDINPSVVKAAKSNLKYFDFPDRINLMDAAYIEGSYDTSIIDLPYGLLSIIDKKDYYPIIKNIRNICKRSVILSASDISDIIQIEGFNIEHSIITQKGSLSRHIYVCF